MEEYKNGSPSYYSILGVSADSSNDEIRRAYRKLAMQWHPDKWARRPSLLGKAKRKFQQIQEAYSVLSDRSKRMMYDSGFYDPHEEEDEGFADFLQEMASLIDNVRKEGKVYSMDELQGMFQDMTKCYETTQWSGYTEQFAYDSSLQLQDMTKCCETTQWSGYTEQFAYDSSQQLQDMTKCCETTQWSGYTKQFAYDSSQRCPPSFAFNNSPEPTNWQDGGKSARAPCSSGSSFRFTSV